jgi:ribosomal protein S18 acetylase RimI-like enzyme
MFLAYEVKEANLESFRNQPLLLDLDRVYNLQSLSSSHNRNTEYVRGDILGFCEITQRSYGLGHIDETEMMRPILTNLAVSQEARTYGIGSKLLDECERHVAQHWKMNEMVLEVEDYNNVALEFYAKRGYQVIFNDPASRRFDVGGLMLRKVRCTRQILRKVLAQQRAQSASEEYGATWDLFQKFRETVGVF